MLTPSHMCVNEHQDFLDTRIDIPTLAYPRNKKTPHMRAQTWAHSHSLTGSCALFVHNPLHLFLSSAYHSAHTHCFDV